MEIPFSISIWPRIRSSDESLVGNCFSFPENTDILFLRCPRYIRYTISQYDLSSVS